MGSRSWPVRRHRSDNGNSDVWTRDDSSMEVPSRRTRGGCAESRRPGRALGFSPLEERRRERGCGRLLPHEPFDLAPGLGTPMAVAFRH